MADSNKKDFVPVKVTMPDGTVQNWPFYGPEGQPLIISMQGTPGEQMPLAMAEREAPDLTREVHQALVSLSGETPNKYGLPPGMQLGQDARVGEVIPDRYDSGYQNETAYGRDVKVHTVSANPPTFGGLPAPFGQGTYGGPSTPKKVGLATMWTISVRSLTAHAGDYIALYINYGLGGLNEYEVLIFPVSKVWRAIDVQGRNIRTAVAVLFAGDNPNNNYDCDVEIAVEPEQYFGVSRYGACWYNDAKTGGNFTTITNYISGHPGKLFRFKGPIIATADGQTAYIMALDDPGDLSVSRIIPGTVFRVDGNTQNVDINDSTDGEPEWDFQTGLSIAISSTPDVYTAQATATKFIGVKLGLQQ